MVLTFVILYLLISVGIGLLAATRVHNAKDFAVAGRSLPVPIVMATVFATWFGAEAVMGISATFAKEGLRGVVADPFGSSLCLVLAGLFFAPRFYRLNLLTVGDYYRLRYDRRVEVLCTLCIVASYLGWVAAQFKVLGLVLNVVTEGAVSQAARHGDRRPDRTDLYDVRRHVFRGDPRFRPTLRHRRRIPVYRQRR